MIASPHCNGSPPAQRPIPLAKTPTASPRRAPARSPQLASTSKPPAICAERRPHLGGALGAALLHLALKKRWVTQQLDSRILTLTSTGRHEMHERFGLMFDEKATLVS